MAEEPLDDTLLKRLQTDAAQEEIYDRDFSVGGSFGVRLSKTGRKAFFVIYPLNGKRKRMTLGNYPLLSVTRARERALSIIERAGRGEDAAAEQRTYQSSESFSDVVTQYQKHHLAARSKKTAQEYERIISKELLPLWADRKARDIEPHEVTRLIANIVQKRNAPVLAARIRAVASSIFSFAVARGFMQKNPARETEAPIQHAQRERVLALKEIHSLFHALKEESIETQALFKILILTGQRISKVLSMSWHDIRIDSWHVPLGEGRFGSVVHLVPQVMQVLKEVHGEGSRPTLVFPATRGAKRSLSRAVERLNNRMDSNPHWNALDLYRTFQVGLSRLGVRPDVIDVLQQRATALTRRRFVNAPYDYSEDIRDALQKWAKAVVPHSGGPRSEKVVPLFK